MGRRDGGKSIQTPYRELEARHDFGVYLKRDVVIVRGKGAHVWDQEGREYIDCAAGMGVAALGHGHPVVLKALKRQAERLITCANLFYNDQRAIFEARMAAAAPEGLDRVFLCNSGSESVEAALKFARFTTGKTEFVCAERGYHGRTLGALSATHKPAYREPYEPLVPGFRFAAFDDYEAFERQVTDETAAILLEVVQGEGGVHPGSRDFFRKIRSLCDKRQILLIFDEVQTGLGRTGRIIACQHMDIVPDMLCMAKALAGGLPMGAVLCGERIEKPVGRHGSTFGGNPLVCAVAADVLEFIHESGLIDEVRQKGNELIQRLRERGLRGIKEVRGLGLMIGIETVGEAAPYVAELQEQGILALTAGSRVIRLLPPLIIPREDLIQVSEVLCEIIS